MTTILTRVKESFRLRLALYLMLVTSVSLVICCGVALYTGLATQKESLLQHATDLANMLSVNSAAALLFDEPESADNLFTMLRVDENILGARIYRLGIEGGLDPFASYVRDENVSLAPPAEPLIAPIIQSSFMQVTREIWFEGELLGYITLQVSLRAVYQYLTTLTTFIVLAFLLSLLLSMILSLQLQKILMQPVKELGAIAKKIITDGDYSLRATATSSDEIGQLTQHINRMLDEVERHDRQRTRVERKLRDLNENLGKVISERTHELEESNRELTLALRSLNEQRQERKPKEIASLGGLVAHLPPEGDEATSLAEKETSGHEDHDFDAFLSTGLEVTDIIQKSLDRASDLIQTAAISTPGNHGALQTIRVGPFLNGIVSAVQPRAEALDVQLCHSCPQDCQITTLPDVLSLVVNNILLHTIDAIASPTETIELELCVTALQPGMAIRVRLSQSEDTIDLTGASLCNAETQRKAGVGLHVIHNLLERSLKGRLRYDLELPDLLEIQVPDLVVQENSTGEPAPE